MTKAYMRFIFGDQSWAAILSPYEPLAQLVTATPTGPQAQQATTTMLRNHHPSICLTTGKSGFSQERHITNSSSVTALLRDCGDKTRSAPIDTVDDDAARNDWQDLRFALEAGLIEISIRATTEGQHVVATLERLGDELSGEQSGKGRQVECLQRDLAAEQEASEALRKAVLQTEANAESDTRDLQRRLRKMETDMARVRLEVGKGRWREILGGEG